MTTQTNRPGLGDYLALTKYKTRNLMNIAAMAAKHGPIDMAGALMRYPWIWELLKVNRLMSRQSRNRSGNYRRALGEVFTTVVIGVIELLEGIFYRSDRMVLHEDMVPPEIFRAMGLAPWMPELLGILLPMLEPAAMEEYIDLAENEGVPPDICSLPKATMGMALSDRLPPALAAVSSNLPCDGGMSSYALIERQTKLPTFRLDIPFNFMNEKAVGYFAGELRAMIAWLEERTPGRMDWERLRDILEKRNRMAEYELEIWDMIRSRPAPLAAEAVYLSHLWAFNVMPGQESSVELFRKLRDLCADNLRKNVAAVPGEKHRALLWNPPTLHYLDLFVWAERRYGVSLIMDSMSYNRIPFIDTSSPDTMLEGLARTIMQGPMARHTRGPAENYFADLFQIVREFGIDMLWVAGHIGCKNTQALNGMLRERCREEGLPLLIIDYDLSDTRIVPAEGIKKQVDHFMENIMRSGISA